MKMRYKLIVVFVISAVMLIGGIFFAVNYKNSSINSFYGNGYIINTDGQADTSVDKVYFSQNTKYYERIEGEYSFTDSDGDKAYVSEASFVHYDDGSLMALSDGVAIDLDRISPEFTIYYNVFKGTTLNKTDNNYELKNLESTIKTSGLLFKISDNKYLLASANDQIQIVFADGKTTSLNNYVEIEYANENIIKIYNDTVSYKTIASGTNLVVGNRVLNLEYKIISKDGVKCLTMADMVINADDNIEVLPVPPTVTNTDKKVVNGNGETVNIEQNNTDENYEIIINSTAFDPLNSAEEIVYPEFSVDSFKETMTGIEKLEMTVRDDDGILSGDMQVKVLDNENDKVVCDEELDNWAEGQKKYIQTAVCYNKLKPDYEYKLVVEGQYEINGVKYDRTFVSKIFRTLPIGLNIYEDYITSDTISFNVEISSSFSDKFDGFEYSLIPVDASTSAITGAYSLDDGELFFDNLDPNLEYKLNISGFVVGTTTIKYDSVDISYKTSTLKKPLTLSDDYALNYDYNEYTKKITLSIDGLYDADRGVKSYNFNVYDCGSNLESCTLWKKIESDKKTIEIDPDKENFPLTIGFSVEIVYDDNQKNYVYETKMIGPLKLESSEYSNPVLVEFIPGVCGVSTEICGTIQFNDGYKKHTNPEDELGLVQELKRSRLLTEYRIELREKDDVAEGETKTLTIKETYENQASSDKITGVNIKNLRPNTKYIMTVSIAYKEDDNVNGTTFTRKFDGYLVVSTGQTDPVNVTVSDATLDDDDHDLFRVKLNIKDNQEASVFDAFASLRVELLACKTGNQLQCYSLDKLTLPKASLFKEAYTIVKMESEYGSFTETDEDNKYVRVFTKKQQDIISFLDGNWRLLLKIEGESDRLSNQYSISTNFVVDDDNEADSKRILKEDFSYYVVNMGMMKPKINIEIRNVQENEPRSSDNINTNIEKAINGGTTVATNITIKKSSDNTNSILTKISYGIYEVSSSEDCKSENNFDKDNPIDTGEINDLDEQEEFKLTYYFSPYTDLFPGANKNPLVRGKIYCFAVGGEYIDLQTGEEKSLSSEGDYLITNNAIFASVQRAKITGYLKSVNGNTATFALKIKDPDFTLNNIVAELNNESAVVSTKTQSQILEAHYDALYDNYYNYDFNFLEINEGDLISLIYSGVNGSSKKIFEDNIEKPVGFNGVASACNFTPADGAIYADCSSIEENIVGTRIFGLKMKKGSTIKYILRSNNQYRIPITVIRTLSDVYNASDGQVDFSNVEFSLIYDDKSVTEKLSGTSFITSDYGITDSNSLIKKKNDSGTLSYSYLNAIRNGLHYEWNDSVINLFTDYKPTIYINGHAFSNNYILKDTATMIGSWEDSESSSSTLGMYLEDPTDGNTIQVKVNKIAEAPVYCADSSELKIKPSFTISNASVVHTITGANVGFQIDSATASFSTNSEDNLYLSFESADADINKNFSIKYIDDSWKLADVGSYLNDKITLSCSEVSGDDDKYNCQLLFSNLSDPDVGDGQLSDMVSIKYDIYSKNTTTKIRTYGTYIINNIHALKQGDLTLEDYGDYLTYDDNHKLSLNAVVKGSYDLTNSSNSSIYSIEWEIALKQNSDLQITDGIVLFTGKLNGSVREQLTGSIIPSYLKMNSTTVWSALVGDYNYDYQINFYLVKSEPGSSSGQVIRTLLSTDANVEISRQAPKINIVTKGTLLFNVSVSDPDYMLYYGTDPDSLTADPSPTEPSVSNIDVNYTDVQVYLYRKGISTEQNETLNFAVKDNKTAQLAFDSTKFVGNSGTIREGSFGYKYAIYYLNGKERQTSTEESDTISLYVSKYANLKVSTTQAGLGVSKDYYNNNLINEDLNLSCTFGAGTSNAINIDRESFWFITTWDIYENEVETAFYSFPFTIQSYAVDTDYSCNVYTVGENIPIFQSTGKVGSSIN